MNYLTISGLLATAGLLVPYLGRTFQPLGIHGRIIGLSLMLISGLMALRMFVQRKPDLPLLLLPSCFFALFFFQAEPIQFSEILHPQLADGDYYQGKLGRFVQLGLPVFLIGFVLSSARNSRSFNRGLGYGMVIAAIAAVIIATIHPYLFFATRESASQLLQARAFSTISISIIVSLTFCWLYASALESPSAMGKAWRFAGALVCLVFVIVCRQRAHLVFVIAFIFIPVLVNVRRIVLALATVTACWLILELFGEAILGPAVVEYWALEAIGGAAEKRAQMLQDCFASLLSAPGGRGLGSFALFFDQPYPHNPAAEAAFELGVPGIGLLIWIYALIAWRCWRAAKIPGSMFSLAAVAFIFAHSLKAGEMIDMVSWTCFFAFLLPQPTHLIYEERNETTSQIPNHD